MTKLEVLKQYPMGENGLKFINKDDLEEKEYEFYHISNMYIEGVDLYSDSRMETRELIFDEDVEFIPCMYNLDLTQPIFYEGKEIVPIVELHKIDYMLDGEDEHRHLKKTKHSFECLRFNYPFSFYYKIEDNKFWMIQLLLKWRINLWLKDDEYINVNDLDVNPYK